MFAQEVDNLQGILYMAFYAQAQRLYTLQQNEGVEGRDGSTRVAQYDGTNARYKGSSTYSVSKDDAMIRG